MKYASYVISFVLSGIGTSAFSLAQGATTVHGIEWGIWAACVAVTVQRLGVLMVPS